jgi:hypothetical protein
MGDLRRSPSPSAGVVGAVGPPRVVDGADNCVTGTVRDLQQRTESQSSREHMRTVTIWYFRVERHDPSGNQLPPVPVEMRGYSFSGALSNGDEISLHGRWRDGTLRATEVTNLTTGARVRAKYYSPVMIALMIVVFVLIAYFWAKVLLSW